jgi:hypothetical protein
MVLLASQAAYLVLARFDARSGAGPVLGFLALLALLFALYAAAARIVFVSERASQARLGLIVVGGLLFRVTLLPAGLPPGTASSEVPSALADDLTGRRVAYERFLLYDDDVWRYLWDGHATAEGVNPYRHAPGDAAADALAEGEGVNALWIDVRDNVNHPEVPTIYPPLAQAIFLLSHALAPGSVLALKVLMVGADLLAAVFVTLSLRGLGRREEEVLLYLWNPLVIKEFAGSAHADSLLVAALAASVFFVLRESASPRP